MKKILVLALAAVLLIAMTACKVTNYSTSTSTLTTSVTDAEGNTKTNTVEVSSGTDGVQVKNETTTETPDEKAENAVPEDWYDTFSGGAEGTDADGEDIYFAYDDPNDIKYAMLVTVSPDKTECHVRNGEVIWNEETESSAIYDKDLDVLIPFEISESDEDDTFIMTFLVDNDVVTMRVVEQDVIINDIQSVMSNYTFE
ncbi:MAG: hypothetical protein II914_02470 [Clostridia bacterium]|nr:hypothetical protein [Clostridia bacterium]